MFTGIVRELGAVHSVTDVGGGVRLELDAPQTANAVVVGDSVSVNGVCLTAVVVAGARLAFDAVPETLGRSSLGRVRAGSAVNVEPALRVGEPLGGHYVQGHVDAVGTVVSVAAEGDGSRIAIDAPGELLRYCVEKGSITVEGVSLTIARLTETGFEIALIPHTLEATTLGALGPGDPVNLEVDVLAKYVERLLSRPTA
ncbi:MAG: riboflavin synthase [Gaiellaceae bacterium MAG52_C11]|nr:riboflavin synthase [Candidatus Gaiellasilicea maunaloa]